MYTTVLWQYLNCVFSWFVQRYIALFCVTFLHVAHAKITGDFFSTLSSVLHCTILHYNCTALYCTRSIALYCTICTAMYCTLCTSLYCTLCTVLYCTLCTALYCTICTALYCTLFTAIYCTICCELLLCYTTPYCTVKCTLHPSKIWDSGLQRVFSYFIFVFRAPSEALNMPKYVSSSWSNNYN